MLRGEAIEETFQQHKSFEDSSGESGRKALNQHTKQLLSESMPVKFSNKNKSGKCGMCGIKARKLYLRRVGCVDFMICENCKSIMDL